MSKGKIKRTPSRDGNYQNPHPGKVLQKRLAACKHTQKFLAERIGVDRSRITLLITGKIDLSFDTAQRLGIFYGQGTHYWLTLQNKHDIEKSQVSGELAALQNAIIPWRGSEQADLRI